MRFGQRVVAVHALALSRQSQHHFDGGALLFGRSHIRATLGKLGETVVVPVK